MLNIDLDMFAHVANIAVNINVNIYDLCPCHLLSYDDWTILNIHVYLIHTSTSSDDGHN